jgi:hypothetical protein
MSAETLQADSQETELRQQKSSDSARKVVEVVITVLFGLAVKEATQSLSGSLCSESADRTIAILLSAAVLCNSIRFLLGNLIYTHKASPQGGGIGIYWWTTAVVFLAQSIALVMAADMAGAPHHTFGILCSLMFVWVLDVVWIVSHYARPAFFHFGRVEGVERPRIYLWAFINFLLVLVTCIISSTCVGLSPLALAVAFFTANLVGLLADMGLDVLSMRTD